MVRFPVSLFKLTVAALTLNACAAAQDGNGDPAACAASATASATPSASSAPPPAPPAGTLLVCERPESARFDAQTASWYVSCQAKADVPGDGFIAKVDAPGTQVVTPKFAIGLNEPKGIAINGGKLYVSDVNQLVTVNLSDGAVLTTTSIVGIDPDVPASPFLNDVVVDPATGSVYVSDNRNNMLYGFDSSGGTPKLLVKDPALEAPNGLVLDARDAANPGLLIATMGPGLDAMKGVTTKLGSVMFVSLSDLNDGNKQVTPTIVSQRVGNLDGIALDGADVIVSDFFAGRVMKLTPTTGTPLFGEADAAILKQALLRAADLDIDPATRRLAVPETNNGAVVFLSLP